MSKGKAWTIRSEDGFDKILGRKVEEDGLTYYECKRCGYVDFWLAKDAYEVSFKTEEELRSHFGKKHSY